MAKRKTPINRLKISDGIVESCRALTENDHHNALLWAAKVVELVSTTHALTEDEARYIREVINNYGKGKKSK